MAEQAIVHQSDLTRSLEKNRRHQTCLEWGCIIAALGQVTAMGLHHAHRAGLLPVIHSAWETVSSVSMTIFFLDRLMLWVLRKRRDHLKLRLCSEGGVEAFGPLSHELFSGDEKVDEQVRHAVLRLLPRALDARIQVDSKQCKYLRTIIDLSVSTNRVTERAPLIALAARLVCDRGGAAELVSLEKATEGPLRNRYPRETLAEIDNCINILRRRITRRLPKFLPPPEVGPE